MTTISICKSANPISKSLVSGFIHEHETYTNVNIPPLLVYSILLFYDTMDKWNHKKSKHAIIKHNLVTMTQKGKLCLSHKITEGIYKWSFKVIQVPKEKSKNKFDIGIHVKACQINQKLYYYGIVTTSWRSQGTSQPNCISCVIYRPKKYMSKNPLCKIGDIIEMILDLEQRQIEYFVNKKCVQSYNNLFKGYNSFKNCNKKNKAKCTAFIELDEGWSIEMIGADYQRNNETSQQE
eukprot:172194_1